MRKVSFVLTATVVGASLLAQSAANADGRDAKRDAVTFRIASTDPGAGLAQAKMGRDSTIFVGKHAILSGSDVTAAETFTARNGSDLELKLTGGAADRIANAMRDAGANMLAVYVNGRLTQAGQVNVNQADGIATITDLDSAVANRLSSLVTGKPVAFGATIALVATRNSVAPGETITVDAYVSGATDVRTYQVTLDTTGGESGAFEGTDLWIDGDRPDFLFRGQQKLDAVDRLGGRLGAVMIEGGVDANRRSYLGSFELRASDDAFGAFTVDVKVSTRSSLLWSSANKPVPFNTHPVTIAVGTSPRVQPKNQ